MVYHERLRVRDERTEANRVRGDVRLDPVEEDKVETCRSRADADGGGPSGVGKEETEAKVDGEVQVSLYLHVPR